MGRRYNKLDTDELKSLFLTNDILLFTETWLNDNHLCNVDDFNCYKLNRKRINQNTKRDSGGIIIYVNHRIDDKVSIVKTSDDRLMWMKIQKDVFDFENDVLLCIAYNVPTGSAREVFYNSSIFDVIADDVMEFNNVYENKCSFLITGDLNARVGKRKDFVTNDNLNFVESLLPDDYIPDITLDRNSQDNTVNENGCMLLDFCRFTGISIANGRVCEDKQYGKYTCIKAAGSSLVDYVLCMSDLFPFFSRFVVSEPSILSDHCHIQFTIQTNTHHNTEPHNNTDGNNEHTPIDFIYKWSDDKKQQYLENLQSDCIRASFENIIEHIQRSTTENDIDENLRAFSNTLHDACEPLFTKSCSGNPTNRNTQPWYDYECKVKQKDFYNSLDMYRTENSTQNRINMTKSRSEYKSLLRSKRFQYDKKQTQKLNKMRGDNAKQYWRLLRDTCQSSKIKAQISLDTFTAYFKAINNPEGDFYQPDEDVIFFNERYVQGELQIMFQELNSCITNDEIAKACKQLSNGKSGGPDKFLNEFFKYGVNHFILCLNKLFNKIFDLGYFPETWANGYIIPLHKKGNINNHENYRGITLLSTLGKLYTRVINNRLSTWAEDYYVYIDAQAGFRTNMSTTDNVFILNAVITHMLNSNKKLFTCFVDYTKAFDLLVHENIWYKLIKLGLRGKILNIIKSFYFKLKSSVKLNNEVGESFLCSLGVAQGDCLSPFLFSMYINDLEETLMLKGHNGVDMYMLKLYLLLYADDIVIMSETAEDLQNALDILKTYCDRWKLSVNVNKTKIMVFRKGGRLARNLRFMYGDNEIEIVTEFAYLGITLSPSGSFYRTFETLSGQAIKAIFKLQSYLYKFTTVTVEHKLSLFDKLILPILNYGSQVWGFAEGQSLELIHTKFCKRILGVRQQTQNNFVYSELGRYPLKCYRIVNIIKFWFKILKCPDLKLLKISYLMLINDLNLNPQKPSWVKSLKCTLETMGFHHVWLSQGVGNENAFISLLKQRSRDVFLQTLHVQLHESTRASTYLLYHNFGYKTYLKEVKIHKYRQALARFRLSAHKLAIETGRWHKPQKIPRNERKCTLCNILEDEFHFIFECKMYVDLRIKYINSYFWKRPNIIKFSELLLSENYAILNNLATFIFKAFEVRKVNLNF